MKGFKSQLVSNGVGGWGGAGNWPYSDLSPASTVSNKKTTKQLMNALSLNLIPKNS